MSEVISQQMTTEQIIRSLQCEIQNLKRLRSEVEDLKRAHLVRERDAGIEVHLVREGDTEIEGVQTDVLFEPMDSSKSCTPLPIDFWALRLGAF